MSDNAQIKLSIPSRYAGLETRVRDAVHAVLARTAKCPNPWHDTAPARAVLLCPEC
jgi:hypothetical protein